jgi:2-oxoglutarate dehydrogenase E2 component (dihydrolipoamide succinyltransferase)
MSTEIRVPALGESIVEATISKWLKQEGESVTTGEPILELETDKVNLEVSAEQSGVLASIAKREGDTVQIGDVVGTLDGGSGGGDGSTAPATSSSAPPAPAQQEPTPPPPAPSAGLEGAAPPRRPASSIVPEDLGSTDAGTASKGKQPEPSATPVAQNLAKEHAINIQGVKGSGPGGRVTKGDVLSQMQPPPAAVPPQPATPAPTPTAPSSPPASAPAPQASGSAVAGGDRQEERIKMPRRRQVIAQRLVEVQRNAAILTTFNEIDMHALTQVRKRRKERFKERHDVNLGFMSFFVKAVVGALKQFPYLNAEIQGEEIVLKHYYDISVAVSTESGLLVPVVRDADRKTFAQIERDIMSLAERARNNTITLEELQGGSFSITNGGVFGSLMSTPILNAPQVGILGMHKIEQRPVVVDGEITIRPMMYVALSYDHRIVDGKDSVSFLVRVKELLEDPELLLLEG